MNEIARPELSSHGRHSQLMSCIKLMAYSVVMRPSYKPCIIRNAHDLVSVGVSRSVGGALLESPVRIVRRGFELFIIVDLPRTLDACAQGSVPL